MQKPEQKIGGAVGHVDDRLKVPCEPVVALEKSASPGRTSSIVLDAMRTQSANDNAPEYGIDFRVTARRVWEAPRDVAGLVVERHRPPAPRIPAFERYVHLSDPGDAHLAVVAEKVGSIVCGSNGTGRKTLIPRQLTAFAGVRQSGLRV